MSITQIDDNIRSRWPLLSDDDIVALFAELATPVERPHRDMRCDNGHAWGRHPEYGYLRCDRCLAL